MGRCPRVTAGPAGQYVTNGPVGPYVARGLVGPCGTLSPCDFETVGLCGTSSPSDHKSAILVDSGGTFPSSDVAVMWDPTIPAESASLRGPVGPVMSLRTFFLSDQIGGECMDLHGRRSGPDVVETPAMVAAVDLRAGSTETDVLSCCSDDCEACLPWDAPEVVVDIHSKGVVPLGSIPDVVGLVGRRPDAAESRILQGRDVRSIPVLVPDLRGECMDLHGGRSGPDVVETPAMVAAVDLRAGSTETDVLSCCADDCEACLPWDAPEVVVDIHSKGVVPLGSIPDVVGLVGRRPDAAESRILQGRDVRSIPVLVPHLRGLEQNFHDVTIVDMGDVPESSVSLPELSVLC